MTNFAIYGGTYQRKPDSVAAVSFWHIPGGCNYDQAHAVKVYFSTHEAANEFAQRNSNPPEMAMVVTL